MVTIHYLEHDATRQELEVAPGSTLKRDRAHFLNPDACIVDRNPRDHRLGARGGRPVGVNR